MNDSSTSSFRRNVVALSVQTGRTLGRWMEMLGRRERKHGSHRADHSDFVVAVFGTYTYVSRLAPSSASYLVFNSDHVGDRGDDVL